MRKFAIVTDDDLARARSDLAFRHQLVAENLDFLIAKLNKLRAGSDSAQQARQIREGVDLAVKLADLLQKLAIRAARAA